MAAIPHSLVALGLLAASPGAVLKGQWLARRTFAGIAQTHNDTSGVVYFTALALRHHQMKGLVRQTSKRKPANTLGKQRKASPVFTLRLAAITCVEVKAEM
eukprot:5182995-Amphidinium_carterae.1